MTKKRMFSLLIAMIMAFAAFPATSALAETTIEPTEYEIQLDADTSIIVSVPEEYQSLMSEEDLIVIALNENLQDGERINIHYVEEIEPAQEEPLASVFGIYTYNTTLSKTGSEMAVQNYFVISVAKGQVTTLKQEFIQTMSAGVAVNAYKVTAELKASVTASHSTTQQFSGPPETSIYNSRQFRVQFYAQKYIFTQTRYFLGVASGTVRGTVDMPTRWASYSIDSTVR